MQVFFKNGAKKVLPKSEGLTLLHYKSVDLYYVRKYFVPPKTEHNTRMGSIFKNLRVIWNSLPVEYKEQLKHSAELYNAKYRQDMYPINSYAFFTKLMFELLKQNLELDLTKMTVGETSEILLNCEWLMVNVGGKPTDIQLHTDSVDVNESVRRIIDNIGDSFLSREEIFLERTVGA